MRMSGVPSEGKPDSVKTTKSGKLGLVFSSSIWLKRVAIIGAAFLEIDQASVDEELGARRVGGVGSQV
jgi:hypothetical protein